MITRRHFTTALAASVTASAVSGVVGAESTPKIRNVVLVHGAYADGSCWSDVIGRLQAVGLKATAVQHPLSSLADDVAATRRILALQDGPTVLVGHSFGGTIISEAGDDPKVASLVYVAARAPDAGEDYAALAAKYPRPPASAGLVAVDGFAQLNEETFLKYFAGDVDPVKARILFATQGRVSTSLFATRTTMAAWRNKPTWYQVSSNDMTISPELQRFLAKRMNATTIEVASSHVSMISHPREIAELILTAAS